MRLHESNATRELLKPVPYATAVCAVLRDAHKSLGRSLTSKGEEMATVVSLEEAGLEADDDDDMLSVDKAFNEYWEMTYGATSEFRHSIFGTPNDTFSPSADDVPEDTLVRDLGAKRDGDSINQTQGSNFNIEGLGIRSGGDADINDGHTEEPRYFGAPDTLKDRRGVKSFDDGELRV